MGNSKWLNGVLLACEGNLDASIGLIQSWDGITALHLFNEIEHIHKKLWTQYTSILDLENARSLSLERPHELLWNSAFIRELVLSIKGLDMGKFHSLEDIND